MAKVEFPKGSEEWQMFTEYWNLCKEYWQPESTEEYWQALYDDCKRFGEKYKSIPLGQKLALAFLHDAEERWKNV